MHAPSAEIVEAVTKLTAVFPSKARPDTCSTPGPGLPTTCHRATYQKCCMSKPSHIFQSEANSTIQNSLSMLQCAPTSMTFFRISRQYGSVQQEFMTPVSIACCTGGACLPHTSGCGGQMEEGMPFPAWGCILCTGRWLQPGNPAESPAAPTGCPPEQG